MDKVNVSALGLLGRCVVVLSRTGVTGPGPEHRDPVFFLFCSELGVTGPDRAPSQEENRARTRKTKKEVKL